jgi:hypothetical protein
MYTFHETRTVYTIVGREDKKKTADYSDTTT